jgi:hypothetical protein
MCDGGVSIPERGVMGGTNMRMRVGCYCVTRSSAIPASANVDLEFAARG